MCGDAAQEIKTGEDHVSCFTLYSIFHNSSGDGGEGEEGEEKDDVYNMVKAWWWHLQWEQRCRVQCRPYGTVKHMKLKRKEKKHRMVALWHHNNDEIFNFTKWWRGRTPQHTLPQQVWTTVGSVVVGTWCRLAAVAQLNVVSAWRVSGWNPAWIRGLFDEIQEAAARLLLFTPFSPLSQPTSHQHQHHHHHPHDQDSYSPHSLPGWKTVFFVDGGHPQSQLHNSNVFLVIHHGTVHFY